MESSVLNVSSDFKVSVTVVLNTSIILLERPSTASVLLTSHLVTCLVFGLLILTAIALNICLLLAIFYSSSLKKMVLNQLISYMSVTCLLDCSVNGPFTVYYMKTRVWLLGPTMCVVNASCTLLITLAIAWILCYMCMERCSSLYKLCQNRRCYQTCKQCVAMATVFIVSCGVLAPVLTGVIEIRAFPSRFSCCVAINRNLYYRIILTISFVLPVAVAVVCLLLAYVKKFREIRDINCQRIDLSYTELFFEESHLWNEWQTSKFVGSIVMLFLILELPFIITLIKTSTLPLKPTQLRDLEKNNSTIRVFYPVAQVTPSNEKIYFWCKFLFCVAYPLVTLLLRKDIRRKINVIASLCRASSSIPNNDSVESPAAYDESPDDFLVPPLWRRRRLSSVTCLKSPIIFGKSRNCSSQFMDLTTGIAKWKASYEEGKSSRLDKPFFADVFDDEDEVADFVFFQDLTEEELNSSEVAARPCTSKTVQTSHRQTTEQTSSETCYNISDVTVEYRCVYDDSRTDNGKHRQKCRRQSKSFNCTRTTTNNNNNYVKCKYYMTFPKMSGPLAELPETSMTSDLMRALQVKRSSRSGVTACDLIPRGTDELLDSPVECKDIVSL